MPHTTSPLASEYSQWFPGKDNVVTDSLSCDDDRLDNKRTILFCTRCPSQILNHFKLQLLPNKITLWLTVLLLRLPMNPQSHKKHTRTELGHGTNGQPTAAGLDYWVRSLRTSHALLKSNCLELLPWICRNLAFQDHLMSDWLTAQLQVPSNMYVRPSMSRADPTHPWTMMASLDSFYNRN